MVESSFEPGDGLRVALTMLDTGEADLIITPFDDVADWAERHGYAVVQAGSADEVTIYEVWRNDEPLVVGANIVPRGRGGHRPRAIIFDQHF